MIELYLEFILIKYKSLVREVYVILFQFFYKLFKDF